jgi:hypothetical protein
VAPPINITASRPFRFFRRPSIRPTTRTIIAPDEGASPVVQPLDPAAAARAREILIESRREGDRVLLSVTDHGPGIPEAVRKHAVERFVRLEASRTLPGSGLGLSLASAVATLHGGELRLSDSHPGLTATLVIPALSAAGDRLAAQTPDVPQKVA